MSLIGKTLEHRRISDRLGMGGMGEVCRAKETKLLTVFQVFDDEKKALANF
jgi:hypothetical protein